MDPAVQEFVELADQLLMEMEMANAPWGLPPRGFPNGLAAILHTLDNQVPNAECLEEIHRHAEFTHATVTHRITGEHFDVSIFC